MLGSRPWLFDSWSERHCGRLVGVREFAEGLAIALLRGAVLALDAELVAIFVGVRHGRRDGADQEPRQRSHLAEQILPVEELLRLDADGNGLARRPARHRRHKLRNVVFEMPARLVPRL